MRNKPTSEYVLNLHLHLTILALDHLFKVVKKFVRFFTSSGPSALCPFALLKIPKSLVAALWW